MVVALASLGVAGARVWPPTQSMDRVTPIIGTLDSMPPMPSNDSLDDAAATVTANDPFRLSNTPADVRYDASSENGATPGMPSPPPIRPVMTVRAIIGGPPWQAIVDGIPGQPAGTI